MAWAEAMPSRASQALSLDAALAVAVTLIGAALAWALAGGLPLVGIDDAAITRSYAQNLAAGHGHVYNVGGERVEGATALLWTLTLAPLHMLTPRPEPLVVGLCAGFTAGAVLSALRLTRLLAARLRAPEGAAVVLLAALMLAGPGYFLWSVWTMMELALWSALLLWLVLCLTAHVEGHETALSPAPPMIVAAALLTLARPEGVAVAAGLCALAVPLRPIGWRAPAAGAVAALAAFAAVTAWRLATFGQPVPNTFYAKVSSDAAQGLRDGLKYLVDFVQGAPLAGAALAAWAGAVAWALAGLHLRDGARGLLIPGAAVAGILGVYAALGGDHFALWRFYQPVAPLLPLAGALGLALVLPRMTSAATAGAAAALVVALGAGWSGYVQARFDVIKEFTLVEQGVGFGRHLNTVEPMPTLGVGPAGGIALAYDGPILDLLGLNWTEMAHANPVKVGMRNHASFDEGVFWAHAPDMVASFNKPCPQGRGGWPAGDEAFGGLPSAPRFRDTYRPVLLRGGGACWPAYAAPGWLARAGDDGIEVLPWPAGG